MNSLPPDCDLCATIVNSVVSYGVQNTASTMMLINGVQVCEAKFAQLDYSTIGEFLFSVHAQRSLISAYSAGHPHFGHIVSNHFETYRQDQCRVLS